MDDQDLEERIIKNMFSRSCLQRLENFRIGPRWNKFGVILKHKNVAYKELQQKLKFSLFSDYQEVDARFDLNGFRKEFPCTGVEGLVENLVEENKLAATGGSNFINEKKLWRKTSGKFWNTSFLMQSSTLVKFNPVVFGN